MTQEHEERIAPVPPVEAGAPESIEPPEAWPKVVGILGIVFSALTMVGFVCSVAGSMFGNLIIGIIPEEAREQARTQMETQRRLSLPYPVVQYGAQVVEVALAIVLLVGAIQILRRSRGGVKTLTGYAWADLVSNFIGTAIGLVVATAMASAIKSDPALAKAAGGFPPELTMAIVIAMFLLQGVWPVFLILWFGRGRIKDAVDRWDGGLIDDLPPEARG